MRPLLLGAFIMALTSIAHAAIKTQPVDYRQGDTALKGFVAYDDAIQGDRPGIVVIAEWWGLNDYVKHRADQLAQLGYVAFVADMYGEGRVTTDPKQAGQWAGEIRQNRELGRQRVQAAVDQLKKQPGVDPAKIAVMGYCFGGTAALDYAFSGADIAGAVSFHGGLGSLPLDEAKNTKAKLLICNGAADAVVPPKDKQALEDALNKTNVDWLLIDFAHAVHAFTNPDSDKLGIQNVGYNEKADKRSWQALRAFLNELFGPAPADKSK